MSKRYLLPTTAKRVYIDWLTLFSCREAKLVKLFVNYQSLRCSNVPPWAPLVLSFSISLWDCKVHLCNHSMQTANPSGPGFMRDGTTKSRAPEKANRIQSSNPIWAEKSLDLPYVYPRRLHVSSGRDMGSHSPCKKHGDPAKEIRLTNWDIWVLWMYYGWNLSPRFLLSFIFSHITFSFKIPTIL